MAVLTVFTLDWSGVNVASAFVAAAADQEFPNDGKTFIYLKNTNAATRTCTLNTAGTIGGHPIGQTNLTVAANPGHHMAGPFDVDIYNAADGNISITWDATSDVLIGVFKLP